MRSDIHLGHIAICVSDLKKSTKFYSETLGFKLTEFRHVGRDAEVLQELKDTDILVQFLRNADGLIVELLQFISPVGTGPRTRCALNRFGLIHLTFQVDDLDAVTEAVEKNGGEVLRHTYMEAKVADGFLKGFLRIINCTDPDGTRIELSQRTVSESD